MKKKQLTRERIIRNNSVILGRVDRIFFAKAELVRQGVKNGTSTLDADKLYVDICDSFTVIEIYHINDKKYIFGCSKRMPNDVPNDRIGIQVAVSRLIKRLQDK